MPRPRPAETPPKARGPDSSQSENFIRAGVLGVLGGRVEVGDLSTRAGTLGGGEGPRLRRGFQAEVRVPG